MNNDPKLTRRELGMLAISGAALGSVGTPSKAPAANVLSHKTGEPTRVTILLFPGTTVLDWVGPYELLQQVPEIELLLAAENLELMKSDSGLIDYKANVAIADIDHTDVLIIPGGAIGVKNASENLPLMNWIRKMDRVSTYTASVCTGALILAKGGFLAGRKATTHWALKDLLTEMGGIYTRERWVRDGKYWTSAGVSAGLDMSLALIAELYGDKRAMMTQLSVEYDPQPPFSAGTETSAPPEVLAALNEEYRRRKAQ